MLVGWRRYGRSVNGYWVGDSGGRGFELVLNALRARLTNGTYEIGDRLPTQRDLANHFSVSRDTVQRVLKALAGEGWIESRQGSGTRVIMTQLIQFPTTKAAQPGRAVMLGSLISEAFEQPEITLDVYTLTSESLDAHVRVQAERIRAGEIAPQRIALRMLLPSEELELPYPRPKDPAYNEPMRQRLLGITRLHTMSLQGALRELRTDGLIHTVDIEIRHAPLAPTFKLYLFNGAEVLQGPYEVIERRIELDSGDEIEALDVLGFGATLTHYVKDDDPNSQGSVSVASMQSWFDSVWNLLST
ncbi:winged helix-turn-helix transcriptional regulator [Streptomyces sp. YC419]|uniref:Winged helix-turn-helix transcriptional regulator n=1 Tax=Streptomyces ureilyticus TaxID=1775131 RepID=A0ABX0DNJ6_9ACTN|nr:winged helix-turn-helix transcriptional regulator [Streptomyces ureilyticus]